MGLIDTFLHCRFKATVREKHRQQQTHSESNNGSFKGDPSE